MQDRGKIRELIDALLDYPTVTEAMLQTIHELVDDYQRPILAKEIPAIDDTTMANFRDALPSMEEKAPTEDDTDDEDDAGNEEDDDDYTTAEIVEELNDVHGLANSGEYKELYAIFRRNKNGVREVVKQELHRHKPAVINAACKMIKYISKHTYGISMAFNEICTADIAHALETTVPRVEQITKKLCGAGLIIHPSTDVYGINKNRFLHLVDDED